MAEVATKPGFTREALQEILRAGLDDRASAAARDEAFEVFVTMPMPSPETEEWRYTDLTELDLAGFVPWQPEPRVERLEQVAEAPGRAVGQAGARSGVAVQHNSSVVVAHLDDATNAAGVHFQSIDDALRDHPELLAGRLHQAVRPDRSKFTALHAAFRTGGTFVLVPAGVKVALPLQTVVHVDRDGLAVFPHTLIVLEEGAELTYIDRYTSGDLERALSVAAVELYLGPGSRLQYAALQEYGAGMTHVAVQRATIGPDAELRTLAVAFGADVSRAEAESFLEGDGGTSEMLGVYFGTERQHIDHRSIQDHIGSRTSSDLLYKGALRGASDAVYTGTVIIEEGAHRCNAYQTNRNVLLSEQAKAHSVPNLEIKTNDPVRCGHAASVGPVDEDEVFYLQTRGIPREEAERLIVFGFFREVLDRVRIEEVRADLERAIEAELSGEA